MINRLHNTEGFLKLQRATSGASEGRLHLYSGRSINLEGKLFNRYPMEAVITTQKLSSHSGLHHSLAAVAALENYLQIEGTPTAQIIRRVIAELGTIDSHIHHFYLEVLPDFFSPEFTLANQGLTAIYFQGLNIENSKSDRFLSEDESLHFLSHFEEMSLCLNKIHKVLSLFCGKYPTIMNQIPGGISNSNINELLVMQVLRELESCKSFIEKTWPDDIKKLVSLFPTMTLPFSGDQGLISFGSISVVGSNAPTYSEGVYIDKKLEPLNNLKITESLLNTFYKESGQSQKSQVYDLNKRDARTWIKSARYESISMQSGPLARLLVTHYGGGNADISEAVSNLIADLGYESDQINSEATRLFAEAIEGRFYLRNIFANLLSLDFKIAPNLAMKFDFSKRGMGLGRVESPAGSLMHQVYIDQNKIMNYRIISPQNWNLSTGDEFGKVGIVEDELNERDEKNLTPLEASRILHSYYAHGLDASQ